MIELTEQQASELEQGEERPMEVVNPRTQERFVLLRASEYARLTEEYDDSPWTRAEIEAVAWENIERRGEDMDEYDLLPENHEARRRDSGSFPASIRGSRQETAGGRHSIRCLFRRTEHGGGRGDHQESRDGI